jgi:hypothetical protein
MKTAPFQMWQFAPLLVAFCLPRPLIAQESNPNPTGAPAPPVIDANSPDVKSTRIYDLGDRRMVVQEVTEATLPIQPPPAPPAPAATGTKLSDDVLAARKAMAAKRHTLNFGGMVYTTADGTCRSLITCHPFDGSPPVVFWSSVDWDLFRVGSFNTPEGTQYILMTMISTPIDIARTTAAWAKRGRTYQAPAIPEFPAGAASYRVISGSPTPAQVADLNAIHAYHDREYGALVAAQAKREEARHLADEAAKQPQPPPPDIIIQGRPMTPEELAPYRSRLAAPTQP